MEAPIILGRATTSPQFLAALEKLPQHLRDGIRARVDTPAARRWIELQDRTREIIAQQRESMARAPEEAATALAFAREAAEEREATEAIEARLRSVIAKSHGLVRRLAMKRD